MWPLSSWLYPWSLDKYAILWNLSKQYGSSHVFIHGDINDNDTDKPKYRKRSRREDYIIIRFFVCYNN